VIGVTAGENEGFLEIRNMFAFKNAKGCVRDCQQVMEYFENITLIQLNGLNRAGLKQYRIGPKRPKLCNL